MIRQMKTLLRVKELKHDQALRTMQTKRQQVEAARASRIQAQATVDESAATYGEREDAIYAEILGEVIDLGGVDETQGRVVQLEKEHTLLCDALERAKHVEARLEGELEEATANYFKALRTLDKFSLITNDMQQQADVASEYREEVEVEELFAQPREKAA